MNLTVKHTFRAQIALLLLSLFLGALCMKPLHVLFIHHEQNGHFLSENAISGEHQHNCPVCNFEFCEFIPRKAIVVPTAYCSFHKEQTPRIVACLIRQSSHLFQLRAPPAL